MDGVVSGECFWTLDRAIAKLRVGPLSGRVDVARPELGLHDVCFGGRGLSGRSLGVRRDLENGAEPSWPLAVADAYVRGDDLVVSYLPSNDWPYSPQVYWSASALDSFDGLLGSLSVLVSVQTHLLDTWPRIVIESRLACNELLFVERGEGKGVDARSLTRDCTIRPTGAACCIVWRLADAPISYAEFMPASDFRELQVQGNQKGNCRVQWLLFAEFLEKGVIRRARLQSAFLTRDNDLELVAACCRAMEQRELPLTT
ncbi:MAG: hypothetical protein L0228_13185 [Planctomycetes bacterium]|nr:hypothetical protein [Planctomycetota bacterium]